MAEQSRRDRMLRAFEMLPPDATYDDAIERLVFLAKIDAGLAELDAGEGVPTKRSSAAWACDRPHLVTAGAS